ncbi:MAG: hypothetical protein HY922_10550 [Elusimicrobia bacterium]|nr:hypothetical protein [Elusimicrobiota bacterium]
MSKNLQAYLKLNLERFPDQYVVLVDGKLIGAGASLEPLLRRARRKHPRKTPFVAKIPGPQTLILRPHARH